MPCSWVEIYQRGGGTIYLRIQLDERGRSSFDFFATPCRCFGETGCLRLYGRDLEYSRWSVLTALFLDLPGQNGMKDNFRVEEPYKVLCILSGCTFPCPTAVTRMSVHLFCFMHVV